MLIHTITTERKQVTTNNRKDLCVYANDWMKTWKQLLAGLIAFPQEIRQTLKHKLSSVAGLSWCRTDSKRHMRLPVIEANKVIVADVMVYLAIFWKGCHPWYAFVGIAQCLASVRRDHATIPCYDTRNIKVFSGMPVSWIHSFIYPVVTSLAAASLAGL